MNRNEKRMVLALAKNMVRLTTLTKNLIRRLPSNESAEYQEAIEEIDEETTKFIDLAKEEWGPSEEH